MRAIYKHIPIFLVDDDAMVRGVVKEYLEDFGFLNIKEFGKSTKAIQALHVSSTPVALVISDWEMPGASGIDLLRTVRTMKGREGTKFIMITSQKSMERIKIAQAASWGVNAYIVKPFRSAVLMEKIFQVMEWDDEDTQESA